MGSECGLVSKEKIIHKAKTSIKIDRTASSRVTNKNEVYVNYVNTYETYGAIALFIRRAEKSTLRFAILGLLGLVGFLNFGGLCVVHGWLAVRPLNFLWFFEFSVLKKVVFKRFLTLRLSGAGLEKRWGGSGLWSLASIFLTFPSKHFLISANHNRPFAPFPASCAYAYECLRSPHTKQALSHEISDVMWVSAHHRNWHSQPYQLTRNQPLKVSRSFQREKIFFKTHTHSLCARETLFYIKSFLTYILIGLYLLRWN